MPTSSQPPEDREPHEERSERSPDPAPADADREGEDGTPSGRGIPPALRERLEHLGVQLGAGGIRRRALDEMGDSSEQRGASADVDGPDDDANPFVRRAGGPPGEVPDPVGPLPGIEDAVPGRELSNAHGACYLSVVRRALGDRHAGEIVGDALAACTESLGSLASTPALRDVRWERTAFLDTETTGLSGGTGTYAFLIGVGRFSDGVFQVRQFFMRHAAEEPAQLAEVARWLEDCDGLVTFNGRTFDAPLLTTRYAVNRQPDPLDGLAHLDLLPAARRLWRRRLDSCALTALERDVLGLKRQDDVPGWLVPERYLRYQRDGDGRPLVGIFRHNALDILSMVSLVTRMARVWRRPEQTLAHPRDWLSLAREYERSGRVEEAIAAYRGALERGLARADDVDEAFERMTLAAKRAGDWEHAVRVWSDLVRGPSTRRLFPYVELAKYYEHRAPERDLERALALSRQARGLVEDRRIRPKGGRRHALEELDHRIARLERRLGHDAVGP